MGVDFIRKAAPSFHKSLDRRAADLCTPTLFGRDLPPVTRLASAELCGGARIEAGEKVHLRIVDTKLVAQRDNVVIAEFTAPPAEFLNQVVAGAGIEKGEVKAVHALSRTVEIGFCDKQSQGRREKKAVTYVASVGAGTILKTNPSRSVVMPVWSSLLAAAFIKNKATSTAWAIAVASPRRAIMSARGISTCLSCVIAR